MAGFTDILKSIFVLGIAMLVGFSAVKTGYIKKEARDAVSQILVRITLPILVITTMTKLQLDSDKIINCVSILVIGWISVGCMYIIGAAIAKLFHMEGKRATMHACLSAFGNIVFIAYPLIQKIYGDEGILYAALFAFANDCYLWTFGVYKLSTGGDGKSVKLTENLKKLINPGTIAVAIALVMLAFGLKFTGALKESLEGIGSCTTYLSMIFLGGTLADIDFRSLYKRVTLFVLIFVKMIAFPALLLFVLKTLNINDTVAGVAVLQVAMPTSTVLSILAAGYRGDVLYSAEGAFLSTLACVGTIPVVYYMILHFI